MQQFKNTVYQRPETKTYQERLTNEDIKEKLKEYTKVDDIQNVPISTHIRYFIIDEQPKKHKFRLGGLLKKIDPLNRYIELSNGQTQPWSVQILNTIFYKKLTDDEKKEEMKKELLTEINTETNKKYQTHDLLNKENSNNIEFKKKIKTLTTKINYVTEENNILKKKNNKLNDQLSKIQIEINKKK